MIDHDFQLKLQAHLDGELAAPEAAMMEDRLGRDAEGRLLLAELRNTRAALSGHEAGLKLPESREFFWSKIEREIARQEQPARAAATVSWLAWLRRHLLPATGLAFAVCLMSLWVVHRGRISGQFAEMELASDDVGAYTYSDPQQKMTMVWFYDRNDNSQSTEPSPLGNVEEE
jgi:anti-sigma factor RsiW